MSNINKTFVTAKVLDNASFSLGDSEIHALMGENGAGKSTLMKILTGVYTSDPDSGEIRVDGQVVHYKHPTEAEKAGIVFIHQELNVVPDLTVEENMFLGKELHGAFGVVDKKSMRQMALETLHNLGVDIDPGEVLGRLSIGRQQMVEIAKALMVDAKVLIMDEPTAALTLAETDVLFTVIRALKAKGVSIVYISHRMEEIFALCDRITILRDGAYVGTKRISDTSMNDVVKMMIGREIGERFPKGNNVPGAVALEVSHLNKAGLIHDVSFSVRAGEVLGVSGLMGAGRTEIMHTIFGSMKLDSGEIKINGKPVTIHNPLEAKRLGIGFVTEDRKSEGLMLDFSIRENIAIANLDHISGAFGVLDKKAERALAEKGAAEFKIRSTGVEQTTGGLSGGNQQKVVFAKWVAAGPKILILDEPTRGVDIGAKKEIYGIINRLTESGVAVIMVSSELPEILGMSDRILVIHEGKAAGILERDEATEESIMILATGGKLA